MPLLPFPVSGSFPLMLLPKLGSVLAGMAKHGISQTGSVLSRNSQPAGTEPRPALETQKAMRVHPGWREQTP